MSVPAAATGRHGPEHDDGQRERSPLRGRRSASVVGMAIERMDHVGIVVDDLAAATVFFVKLVLKLQGYRLCYAACRRESSSS